MAPPKARTAVKRIQSEKEKKKARTSTNSLGTSSKDSLTVSSKDKGKARPSLSPAASFNAKDGPLLDVNDKKWDAIHKSTKEIMGKSTIHLQDHNRVDNILRVFDLNPDFGPSIGLTRLERWQRADDLELDPPKEIREILLTQQGQSDPRYSRDVFHGLVGGLE